MVKHDWSTFDVEIEGERLAKNGLRKRRQQLEAIVEPLATNKKTNDAILFKGKRRYLATPLVKLGNKNRLAVHALQSIYIIEAAWKAGDIDKVVRATYQFARSDHDLWLVERAGMSSIDAAFSKIRRKRKAIASLKKATESKRQHYDRLREEAADRMKTEVPKHSGNVSAAAKEVAKSFSHLEKPPKTRFIELAHKELNNGAPR